MRTRAQAKETAAAGEADAPASKRRGRVRAELAQADTAHDVVGTEPQSVAVTAVRMVGLDEGLYALRVGEIDGAADEVAGMTVPAAQIGAPFAEDGNGVEIIACFPGRGPWIGREGGTVILRSPPGGGYVVVTAYGHPEQSAVSLALDLSRLDRPPADAEEGARSTAGVASVGVAGPHGQGQEVPTEILLHIERAGDRLFPGRGWVGALGRKLRIEAFSIRPLERIAPADIEFKGFLPRGGETQWVQAGVMCGTRGRRLPLIGFAVRMAPQLSGRFDVIYQGSFFGGGISSPYRNGQPCRAATADDPLEAINLRIVERIADPDKGPPPG